MDVVINDVREVVPAKSKPLISQRDYYLNLLTCLGYPPQNPPLGHFLSLYHQLEGRWLIASPIHWQATHNDALILATGKELELTSTQARLWFDALAQFFKEENINMIYHDDCMWLISIDNKPEIFSQSVYSMLHQSLMPAFAKMDKTFFWQRLITEIQMYMGSHPLNAQRQEKPIVNGL